MTATPFDLPGGAAVSPFDSPNPTRSAGVAMLGETADGWTVMREHHLLDLVREHGEDDTRGAQRNIGASEIGSPCTRKLALKSIHAPKRPESIGWRAIVGRSVHAWLEEVVRKRAPAGTAVAELTLWLSGEGDEQITGTADVLVLGLRGLDAEVVDWKVPGPTSMKNAARGRVNASYLGQAQVNGLMFEQALGRPPVWVTIILLPAAGEFRDAVVLRRAYDREAALAVVSRYEGIREKAQGYGLAETVRRTQHKTADDYCQGCQFMGVKVPQEQGEVVLCHGHSAEALASGRIQ